jgi:Carboxypeptidase regulatory-like domain
MKPVVLVGGVVVVIVAAIMIALSTVGGPDLPGQDDEVDRALERTGKTSRADDPGRTEPEPDDPPTEKPGGATVPDDLPRDKITGVVLDDRDQPLAGVRVALGFQTTLASGPPPVLVAMLDRPGISDAAGKFTVEGVRLDGAAVWARLDGYVQTGPTVVVKLGGPPLEIRMRRLLRILGTVVDDSTGESIEKATLLLRRASPTGEADENAQALGYETKGGEFTIPDLAPGSYLISASVPGYDGWTSDALTISRDHPDERVEIRVARTGPWGALRIVVQDPDGTEVPKVNRVFLHNPDTGFLAMTDTMVPTPVRIEAPMGRQILQVFADGYLRHAQLVEVPDGSEAEITVTLSEAGHVRIRVRDGEGSPATGYRLGVFAPDGDELEYDLRILNPILAPTHKDTEGFDPTPMEPIEGTIGKSQVIPGGDVTLKNLPPGLYKIKATKDGFNPVEETVDVKASGTAAVTLTIR